MAEIKDYAASLVERAGQRFQGGELFAKVLTQNDDSGHHGVMVPSDAYAFFPYFAIVDPKQNSTMEFPAFDARRTCPVVLAYKYYQRYPERRVTRLGRLLNDRSASLRLLVLLRAKHADGTSGYYFDCANNALGGRFAELFQLIFGTEIQPEPGRFVVRPVESEALSIDADLAELLARFDEIRSRGWIDSLRTGDTGIGYTFETLFGIEENNDQKADFRGIEIKCKALKNRGAPSGQKINLFQAGPTWAQKLPNRDRIRVLGAAGESGLYSCFSQLTTTPNNLGLLLRVADSAQRIDLQKLEEALGHWSFERLNRRLVEKHSRAVFVGTGVRQKQGTMQYSYEELVYCDTPSIDRFVSLVSERNIVFEFTMSEKRGGKIRNHGYPWRLVRDEFLDQLFAFQAKLR